MPNKIFQTVVDELDFVGDILSIGIAKKAVINEGSTPDEVSKREMVEAVKNHIVPALMDFVSEKKAKNWGKETIKKIRNMEGR